MYAQHAHSWNRSESSHKHNGRLPNEPSSETYDDYVESMRERMTIAYEQTRAALRRAAERNTRYYGIRVRAKQYKKGQSVYYFNPRKYAGRQDK